MPTSSPNATPIDYEILDHLSQSKRGLNGVARSFATTSAGLVFLRSDGPFDNTHHLWLLPTSQVNGTLVLGDERKLVDYWASTGSPEAYVPDALEQAQRERAREQASGITWLDTHDNLVLCTMRGDVYLIDVTTPDVPLRRLAAGPIFRPTFSPTGTHIAGIMGERLVTIEVTSGAVETIAQGGGPVSYGMAEFVAAEEMDRDAGLWWSPSGTHLAYARVDTSPVNAWSLSEPADPDALPRPWPYPASGTPNATVSLHVYELASGLAAPNTSAGLGIGDAGAASPGGQHAGAAQAGGQCRHVGMDTGVRCGTPAQQHGAPETAEAMVDEYITRVLWLDDETLTAWTMNRAQTRQRVVHCLAKHGWRAAGDGESANAGDIAGAIGEVQQAQPWINLHAGSPMRAPMLDGVQASAQSHVQGSGAQTGADTSGVQSGAQAGVQGSGAQTAIPRYGYVRTAHVDDVEGVRLPNGVVVMDPTLSVTSIMQVTSTHVWVGAIPLASPWGQVIAALPLVVQGEDGTLRTVTGDGRGKSIQDDSLRTVAGEQLDQSVQDGSQRPGVIAASWQRVQPTVSEDDCAVRQSTNVSSDNDGPVAVVRATILGNPEHMMTGSIRTVSGVPVAIMHETSLDTYGQVTLATLDLSAMTAQDSGAPYHPCVRPVHVFAQDAYTPAMGVRVEQPHAPEGEAASMVLTPEGWTPDDGPLPVIIASYGGPHARLVTANLRGLMTPAWFAKQGFVVLIVDGPGQPGRGLAWEYAVHNALGSPTIDAQVATLHREAARHPGLFDLQHVTIRGWSFGGYLSARGVLEHPDVFMCGIAGAPVTDWRLYDTMYTERYIACDLHNHEVYEADSLLALAPQLRGQLLIIHGFADDNVVAGHTMRLSRALIEHGRLHSVLPLSNVSHVTSNHVIARNMVLHELAFIRQAIALTPTT